jgi:hypothetical protein
VAWVATAVACGGGAGPEFEDPCTDASACSPVVGIKFRLELRATDADGDDLSYDFETDVPDIENRASITRSPTGYGLFEWTPLASDVQEWSFDFTASDGSSSTTITVPLDVRSANGSETAPVFRKPLGTGTTLDLTQTECLDLEIVIEDQDNAEVTIAQEEPIVEGGEVQQTDGLHGTWHWCPSRAQADAEDRYNITLSANDNTNPKTLKDYLVVLKSGGGTNCPGAAPAISHSPQNENTVVDLTIPADISDDQGLKAAPLFYYSTTNPGATPNLGAMTQVSMLLITGNMQSGQWAADVPNPASAGSTVTLYYVIVANDDDDDMGNCDHRTESQVYSISVTNPGGAGNTGLCESCSNDNQCGNDGDLCIYLAADQWSYCLQECAGPADCPTGYTCSPGPLTSVDGNSGRQCEPSSGSCEMSEVCIDDSFEDNDSRTQAAGNPALPPDFYDLTSCPSGTFDDDEDWFKIDITSDSQVMVALYGDTVSDLDLGLYDDAGVRLSASTSLESDETILRCLTPGTYFIREYAYSPAENDYLLEWSRTPQTCDTGCTDDFREDDDTYSQARNATFLPYSSTGNTLCAGDDTNPFDPFTGGGDWYRVNLVTGETIVVDLTFTQTSFDDDLDLHFLDEFQFDLTPCTEPTGSTCTAAQGQSVDSDEHYEYTVPAGCTAGCDFYVVVHGWDGSSNTYDIAIDVQ